MRQAGKWEDEGPYSDVEVPRDGLVVASHFLTLNLNKENEFFFSKILRLHQIFASSKNVTNIHIVTHPH